MTIPSQGVYSSPLGQVELTGLPLEQFSTLAFQVPSDLATKLNASYTDLRVSIALNVPTDAKGVYYVDNFKVGALTTPPAVLPTKTRVVRDLVGLARGSFM